jgi:outer membrane receptor protein involved in Fe transport
LSSKRLHHLIVICFILSVACDTALAQAADPACADNDPQKGQCDDSRIEQVTVTATRRQSSVGQVPASVTALDGDSLKEMGALTFADYARSVPGLSFTDAGFGGQKIVIRGVSTGIMAESRAATSVYLDETPITDGAFGMLSYYPDPVLVDIDRVEVLRGPQGALFGSGSIGGAIRIMTRQPNVLENGAFTEAILSTTAHGGPGYELNAMFNAPLFQGRGALRGVAYYRQLDGWIDNTQLGTIDVNDNQTAGLRLSGLWQGADSLTVNAKIAYQDRQSDGSGFDQENPPWTQQRFVPEPNDDEWVLLNLDIHYGFGWGEFLSSTSWLDRNTDQETDGAAVFTEVARLTTVTGIYRGKQKDFIQELRLQSTGDAPFDWLLGMFFQDQDYRLEHELQVPGFDELTGGLGAVFGTPDRLLVAQSTRPTEQIAAYFDVIHKFAVAWEGSFGGRWFRFRHARDSSSIGPIAGPGQFSSTRESETGFRPRFGLSYHGENDLMWYGVVAGGYRPGGHNETVFDLWPECGPQFEWAGLPGVPPEYESDSVWSYELGIKTGWLSEKIQINAAVFYLDWSEMQTPATLPCGAQWVQNAGEATNKGAEVELVALVGQNLELTLNGAWTDARLDEDVILLGGRKGDRVPGVPEYAVGGSLSWFFDVLENLDESLRVDFQYVGGSPNGFSYWGDPSRIPSYFLVNLRLGLHKGRWMTSLFIDNLFDERAIVTVHDFPERWVTTARPLTVGVSVQFAY